MQRVSLKLSIALVTFFIGFVVVSVWFFKRQVNSDALLACVSTAEKNVGANDSNSLSAINEEYAVYSAIFNNERYSNETILINDKILRVLNTNDIHFNQEISVLTEDTINDYQTKYKENPELENNFTSQDKVVFLSEKDGNQLVGQEQNKWAGFYKIYPKTNKIIYFSKVGFNQNQTQALVSVSVGCAGNCGKFIFLQKENGKWKIQQNTGFLKN